VKIKKTANETFGFFRAVYGEDIRVTQRTFTELQKDISRLESMCGEVLRSQWELILRQ